MEHNSVLQSIPKNKKSFLTTQQFSSRDTHSSYNTIEFSLFENRHIILKHVDLKLINYINPKINSNGKESSVEAINLSNIIHPSDLPFILSELVNSRRYDQELKTNIRINTIENSFKWFSLNAEYKKGSRSWQGTISKVEISTSEAEKRDHFYEEVAQEERSKISMELHDGIGQDLVLLNILLSQLSDKKNQNLISQFSSVLQKSICRIRELSYSMSPQQLKNESIGDIILKTISNYNQLDGIKFERSLPRAIFKAQPQREHAYHLHHIIQEFCSNSIRHSKGDKIKIVAKKVSVDCYNISIEDNGVGFEITQKKTSDGMGLKNIEKRTKIISDVYSFESSSNGTRLSFIIEGN